MKRAALPLAVAGFACAALLSCHTGVGGHISEPDKDAIRKVVEQATRTIAPPTSDVDAYVKLYYADDARVLPPNHATVTGREAISALFRSEGSIQEFRLTILALEGRNDLAYVSWRVPDEPDHARRRRAGRRQGQVRRDLEEAAGRKLEGDPRRLQLGPSCPRVAAAGDAEPHLARPRLRGCPDSSRRRRDRDGARHPRARAQPLRPSSKLPVSTPSAPKPASSRVARSERGS